MAAFVALLVCAIPGAASAATCPEYGGAMTFSTIDGPGDPEDYCWEVSLSEGQELRQVDERKAEVFYSDGHFAFGIEAVEAHDAIGTSVPTSLAVTGTNEITLTVHHRAGNPVAGSAPFAYPISDGPGWEGGIQSVVVKGPPDESELKPKPTPPVEEAPVAHCSVPALQGRTLRAARRALVHAHCDLGPIRGERSRGARVVKQYRRYGAVLPAGTEVGVKLAS